MDLHFFGMNLLPEQVQTANPIMILLFIPLVTYVIYPAINSVFPLTPPGAVQAPLDLLGAELPAARTAQPEAFIDNSLLEELRASGRLDGATP